MVASIEHGGRVVLRLPHVALGCPPSLRFDGEPRCVRESSRQCRSASLARLRRASAIEKASPSGLAFSMSGRQALAVNHERSAGSCWRSCGGRAASARWGSSFSKHAFGQRANDPVDQTLVELAVREKQFVRNSCLDRQHA